ncbi:putative outer membrane usher protein yqiG precursor [Enterobacteriaceae bacterium bta3-1]|nr:putative outer membrane usher protein yqiG precursor [Enterobacteriaceae bacterium bta3-1]
MLFIKNVFMCKNKKIGYSKLSLLIKKALCSVVFSALVPSTLLATEFNTNFMDVEDRDNIDLSQFEKKGQIPAGQYIVQVSINKNLLPKTWTLEWLAADNESGTQLCLTAEHLQQFGFDEKFIQQLHEWNQQKCLDITRKPELSVKLDKANMLVNLTAPQSWMKYQAKNWTPPEYWDEGISGALLDYNVYANQYEPKNGDSTQNISSYGTLGFNFGAWRFRSDYQYSEDFVNGKSNGSEATLPRTYLFRPIPSISSKFTMGQYDLNSDIFDTFHFTGASLESDEHMLPPDLQGYAPQITGIAQTNAKVTVEQNGRVLYQTTVSPGPFTISDLGNTLQGQMDVTVEEEDGRKSTFQVGSASVPFLTRKGQVRYKTSIGKPTTTSNNDVNNPLFLTSEFSWGWLGNTSLYGGAILTADDYQSISSGIGFNLNELGSISFDITRSEAKLGYSENTQEKKSGYSYRVNYAKRFESTGSQVTFAGYRFSDKEYVTMTEYLNSWDGDENTDDEKESYVLSFNQTIESLGVNAYLNISRDTYWNSGSDTSYSLSLSRNFDLGNIKGISASLSLTRTRWDGENENQYYLSFSIPLGQSSSMSYNVQRYGDKTAQSVSYYDSSDKDNTWNISASADNDQIRDGEPALRGGYQHYSPYGRLNLAASVQPNIYNSLNVGWSGSATATRHGAALHDYTSGNNARMMVDTDGIAGIALNRSRAVTNSYGIGVIPSISNYQTATLQVNSNDLPEGVDVSNSVIRTTLTEGAIGYTALSATKGYQIVGVIRLADGRFPPLGVAVVDAKTNKEVGLVAEDGFVYLSGIQEGSLLRVTWANNTCEISPPNQSNISEAAIILPCKTVH